MEHTIGLGQTIRALRRAKGLTADALARAVGITENAVRKLEAGDSKEPRFSTGLRIAEKLGAEPRVLLGGKRAPTRSGPELASVIKEIRRHRAPLSKEGIEQIYVFGSVARGEATPDSDVDLMVKPSASTRFTLLNIAGVQEILTRALGRKADVVTEGAVRQSKMRASVEEDAVRVF